MLFNYFILALKGLGNPEMTIFQYVGFEGRLLGECFSLGIDVSFHIKGTKLV